MFRRAWWVDFRVGHQRYRKKSPENSRAGARAYEAMMRQKAARSESINGATPDEKEQTFERFARHWFEDYVVPNNKFLEQRMKRYILNSSLIPFFGKLLIRQITTQHVEQYKARTLKNGVSRKTANNRLAVLSKCLTTAYDWLQIQGARPKVALLKCPPPTTNYLSADECEMLISSADGTIREMMLTALRTGMRQGELRALQWSSIDWENRIITVRHSLNDRTKELESPKSNRERHIPMDTDVYGMLLERKGSTGYVFINEDGGPYDSQRIIRRLKDVRKKAGLRNFGWHGLRHTFASQLAVKGVPLHVVQTLLGHSTITTTMRYAHVAPSALRAAIDMLNPKQALQGDFGQPVGNQWRSTQLANSEKS
jgi:integrase